MQYKETITVPSGTVQAEPCQERVQLTEGTLDRLVVDIPAGHEGLAGMSLWRTGTQLYPFTPGEWFTGNDTTIEIDDNLQIAQPPYYLKFKGYNEDETFEHGFNVIIRISRPGERPVEDIKQSLRELSEKSNYPTDSWLKEVNNDLSVISTNISQDLVPKLKRLEDIVNQIKEQNKKISSIEELSEF